MSARTDPAIAALLAAASLALHRATLAPGLAHLGAGDGHELTLVAAHLGVAHPTGYPLWTWIGFAFTRLWPFGEIAHRTNLMSAVLGAAGVGMLFLVGRRLGLERLAAAFAALLFAVSTTFWSQAVVTEVYAPNVLALAATLWLALRWADTVEGEGPGRRSDRRFVAFALAFGLAPGAHFSNLGFAPAYALFVLLVDPPIVTRPRTVALAVAAFALGMAQFAWLPLRAAAWDVYPNVPPTSAARLWDYTFGAFANLRFAFPLAEVPTRILAYLDLVVTDFGWLGTAIGVAGMVVCFRRDAKRFVLVAGMYVTHVLFFSQQIVLDPEVFFVASGALFALFAGFGIDACLGVPPAHAGRAAGLAAVLAGLTLVGPLWPNLRANDRSTDTATHDFYDAVFETLPPGAVLLARGRGAWGAAARYHHQHRSPRPDVVIGTEVDAPLPPPDAPTFVAQWRPPLGVRPGVLPPDPRWVPVLRSAQHELVLYRVEHGDAPPAVARMPRTRLDQDLGDARLLAVDVAVERRRRPTRVRLRAAWLPAGGAAPVVTTALDGRTIEAHALAGVPADDEGPPGATVEQFDLVLPSHLAPGAHALAIGLAVLDPDGVTVRLAPLGAIEVE